MKPIIILPKGLMAPEAIAKLTENDLCVVEAEDPAKVRFLDPIPAAASRTAAEEAAIELSRKVMSPNFWDGGAAATGRTACIRTFVDILVRGTRLDPLPQQREVEAQAYDEERIDEVRRIAREDARAVREAARKAAAADESAAAKKKG